MKSSINVIADACSVSKTTVSKVLTQKAGVSEDMRQRVLEAARKFNYTPKQVAAQETIAIVVSEFAFSDGASFKMMMLASIMGKMVHSGYLLKVVTPEDVDLLVSSYVKVGIVLLYGDEAKVIARKFVAMNIPVISINEQIEDCYNVCTDHAHGVEIAIDHLCAKGHRRISLLIDGENSWGGRMRRAAYQEAVTAGKIEPLPSHFYTSTKTTIVECLNAVRRDDSTALIIQGEAIINEAVYMLDLLRIKVPEELSIISSEIKGRSRWFVPSHTTVDQDHDSLAKKVIEVVQDILRGKRKTPEKFMLPTTLIERNSVKTISI
ncbi:MAG: LacI family DNA-binding transcriptional regulator [Phycisphaerae bacterium]|nr:LacI family DNA-binding transcriptional regulator [Phycisphaerae bacterium]